MTHKNLRAERAFAAQDLIDFLDLLLENKGE